jgi:hypothetical protein
MPFAYVLIASRFVNARLSNPAGTAVGDALGTVGRTSRLLHVPGNFSARRVDHFAEPAVTAMG